VGPLLRSAAVLSVIASLANVAIGGCGARIEDATDGGALADTCTSQGDAAPTPTPLDANTTVSADADLKGDATVDAARDASGPKICNPQDSRTCEVATAAEGAACPATFDQAKAAFTCANYPVGSYWLAGGCGDYLIASIEEPGFSQSTQCVYDASSHALIGSDGYDNCGAFCGGVNHVHWGLQLSPCGISSDTGQGSCNADAGADAD
jgi:hypothetical protein